jgi:hypothetical protein
MFRKLAITCVCCIIAVWAVSASYSQSEGDDTTAPAAVTDDTAPQADVAQPEGDTAQPAVVTTTAEKAKSYFDGAFTYVNIKALFKLTTKDNFLADKIMYKIDGGAEQAFDKEFPITDEGKHTISYYGIDKIGNKEDEKVFHIIVDNTAPEVMLGSSMPIYLANGKYYISRRFLFGISATDALSGTGKISYTVNGKDFSEYATAFSIYADGDVTFSAAAEDNVGNKSSKFKVKLHDDAGKEIVEEKDSLQLFVDNIAPSVTITADKQITPLNGKNIASKEFKYTVAAEDKESGVKMVIVRVDGKGEFTPYDKEIFFTTNGDHFIEAKAIDAVGNTSDTVILSVYVDVIPPASDIQTVTE